jgi:hypothetical protein
MKAAIILFLCALPLTIGASQKAVTEEGDVVILNADGTWVYEDGSASRDFKISTNPNTFSTPNTANFTLKSTSSNATFSIDSKKWKFKKNENGHDSAEYAFEFKKGDLYGLAITEEVEIGLEDLTKIAFENATGAAPDIQIVKKEYRMVNGEKLIYMEMVGTIQSIQFQYLGYYHSNEYGSTQFLTYTGKSLVEKYRKDIDDFLNGFSTAQQAKSNSLKGG